MADMYPPPINHRSDGIPLHQISFTYSRMHIYPGQMYTPPPIDHRSMEYHYTQYVSHIAECTYTNGRLAPSSN